MMQWLRMLISKWFDFITPSSQTQNMALAEREYRRKLHLLSMILVCSFLLTFPLLVLYCNPINTGTFVIVLYEVMVLCALWLARNEHLKLATYLYLFSFLAINILGFISLDPKNSVFLLWTWLPIAVPSILAGLLLPFWSPLLFACIESVSVTGFYLVKHQADMSTTALSPALVPYFLTYMNVFIYVTALIAAIYSFNLDKAVIHADRATELAEAHAQLKKLAVTDPITGLLNHRALTDSLLETLKHAQNTDQQLGLIFADIDHFKQVNDTWGHQAGDAVLAHIASLLQQHAPDAACIGRYGGEEFVLVHLHQNAQQVESMVEQIRTIIAESPAYLPDGRIISVTISMGIAHFPLHGTKSEEILHAADEAMYHAKHTGRNRVCVATTRASEELVLIHG